jgi:thiamine-phosphate pyrophosphorylase
VLCLVTPGRPAAAQPAAQRPEPAPSAAAAERAANLAALIEAGVEAGVDLVQVREPDLPTRVLFEVTARAVARARGTATRVIVNDRADVAIAAGAGGVHLGSRSFPAADVRRIAPHAFLVGRSVHSLEEAQAAAAEGYVDYLIAGTVFPSVSKAAAACLLGVEGLAAIARAVRVPVLAIGGIDRTRVAAVAASGAAGLAAIGMFTGAHAAGRLRETVAGVRELFDRVRVFP